MKPRWTFKYLPVFKLMKPIVGGKSLFDLLQLNFLTIDPRSSIFLWTYCRQTSDVLAKKISKIRYDLWHSKCILKLNMIMHYVEVYFLTVFVFASLSFRRQLSISAHERGFQTFGATVHPLLSSSSRPIFWHSTHREVWTRNRKLFPMLVGARIVQFADF